jgi:hypothetical protein
MVNVNKVLGTGVLLAAAQAQTPTPKLGLNRSSYGVWDRSGGNSVATYPFTRGQSYQANWFDVNTAPNTFDWSGVTNAAKFAQAQNQQFTVQITTVGGAVGSQMPEFLFTQGCQKCDDGTYKYCLYSHPVFRQYWAEMVKSLATHLRTTLGSMDEVIGFVRVDTGATGDEGP